MASQRVSNDGGDCTEGGVLSPHKSTYYLRFNLLAEHVGRKGENRQENRAAASRHNPVREQREALTTAFSHLCSFSSPNIGFGKTGNMTSAPLDLFLRARCIELQQERSSRLAGKTSLRPIPMESTRQATLDLFI